MMRIAIVVEGGIVQAVYSDNAMVEVEVIDKDNEPHAPDPSLKEYPHHVF